MSFFTINKLFLLVVLITFTDLGCTRPSKNTGQSKNNTKGKWCTHPVLAIRCLISHVRLYTSTRMIPHSLLGYDLSDVIYIIKNNTIKDKTLLL